MAVVYTALILQELLDLRPVPCVVKFQDILFHFVVVLSDRKGRFFQGEIEAPLVVIKLNVSGIDKAGLPPQDKIINPGGVIRDSRIHKGKQLLNVRKGGHIYDTAGFHIV